MSSRLLLAGGVVLAFLALASTALWYRGSAIAAVAERDKAAAALTVAVDANKAQQAAIDALREQKDREERILADIAHKLAVNNQLAAERNAAIADLEVNNATVRDYLAAPIPDDLKWLLNGRAGGGR